LVGVVVGASITAAAVPAGYQAYRQVRDPAYRIGDEQLVATGDAEYPKILSEAASRRLRNEREEGLTEAMWDDALARQAARRAYYGKQDAAALGQVARAAAEEAARNGALLPSARRPGAEDRSLVAMNTPGKQWVNLGPTDAKFQSNFVEYPQVDSGRTTGFLLDPRDPNVAYTSTAGGGVWKTFDFSAKNPTWYPITENIGILAVGGIALDPNAPDTLYAGLGDPYDAPGGYVIKSTDGGITWSAPVQLVGSVAVNGAQVNAAALTVRDIQVDPLNSNVVLVGTELGLFRSTNGGATFATVDLPNSGAAYYDGVWSVVFTGSANGQSRWAVSGQTAPSNLGDVWASSDGGATWASSRVAGGLPAAAGVINRMDLAAGSPSPDGTATVVYAQVARGGSMVNILRSSDSGRTWVSALGTLANPTLPTEVSASPFCGNQLISTPQASYNQAIAVDPSNNDAVIIGGTYCAMRTLTGTAASPTWELVSNWLPGARIGDTKDGRLAYVHADHHNAKVYRQGGGYVVVLGTDGGLFVSRNVFDAGVPANDVFVTWEYPNRGIVSHLFYNIASGDEANGSPFVAFGGLQDNGTRFRDSPASPSTFNQVIGGDGIGAAVAEVPGDRIYWGSVQFADLRLCDPDTMDCNRGENWYSYSPLDDGPLACAGDTVDGQFLSRVIPIRTSTVASGPSVLTVTDRGVYRHRGDPFNVSTGWELLGDPAVALPAGACFNAFHRNISASIVHDGLIGVATSGGRFRVTSNCSLTTPAKNCTWSLTNPMGVDLNGNGTVAANESMTSTSGIDFPPGDTGRPLGDVFVVTSVTPSMGDGSPVPAAIGRVLITENRGQTWRSLAGPGLPNVPVDVVRYDPSDLTNRTLYVGTFLGVYRTQDGGQTWERFGGGMPLVQVSDLFVSKTGSMLRASTYGRGVWEIYPSATAEKGVSGTGDFDRNLQIDFRDVLAMASRLGTTPATTTAPFYEWNQDVTGVVNGIDDADLAAVLQKLGSRP
jgi:photosystem II stability/assembly factor-like uncharacterized protein